MIEVTEAGVIQGSDAALVAMKRLRDLGVGLTIDDFGTGYALGAATPSSRSSR